MLSFWTFIYTKTMCAPIYNIQPQELGYGEFWSLLFLHPLTNVSIKKK